MSRIVRFLFIGGILLTASCATIAKSQKGKLIWEENFNGKEINPANWSKIPRGSSDWNRHMSDDTSLYAQEKGNLILRGAVNADSLKDTSRLITGGVFTKGKKSFGLGRWEVRAKLNGAQGAWPAFWLLPENEKWPNGGEIDIMERLNFDSIAYQTVHSSYTHTLNIKKNPPQGSTGKIDPNAYNTYAVALYKDSLVFFINNKKTFSYPRIKTDKAGQFPFTDNPFYLLLDMQLGGSWVGKVDENDLPVEMQIDWVRFYSLKKINDFGILSRLNKAIKKPW